METAKSNRYHADNNLNLAWAGKMNFYGDKSLMKDKLLRLV